MSSKTTDSSGEIGVLSTDSREARVNVGIDGEPIGIMVYLSADELAMLGANPEPNTSITYWINDGNLILK